MNCRFAQLARQGEFDFSGELRVLALLGGLNCVPQLLAIGEFLGRAFGQQHFGMLDARFVRKVMVAIDPLVVQPLAGAIGGSGHGAASARPSDYL